MILGFRYGILNLSEVRSEVDLAAKSSLSFPLATMWLGIQHIIISLLFNIESNLLNSLIISVFSSFLLLNKTESKSENIINFLCLFFEMMLRAMSIARTSAVKMELTIGRTFLIIVLSKTTVQAVLSLSLEPSVKTYRWLRWCLRIL